MSGCSTNVATQTKNVGAGAKSQRFERKCQICEGKGYITKQKGNCKFCKGTGYVSGEGQRRLECF